MKRLLSNNKSNLHAQKHMHLDLCLDRVFCMFKIIHYRLIGSRLLGHTLYFFHFAVSIFFSLDEQIQFLHESVLNLKWLEAIVQQGLPMVLILDGNSEHVAHA